MGTSPKFLILPCETRNRELDAKLLLGCAATDRGFEVFLGAKREINMTAVDLPRSIYVQKSLSKRSYRMYDILDRVGHWIVGADEEGLTYYTPENYLKERVDPRSLNKTRALLAWGHENAEVWGEHPDISDTPIKITGNPRIDLLRPELRPFFQEEVDEIRERLGPFVIINTNFSHINHFFPGLSYARVLLDSSPKTPQPNDSFDVGAARHAMRLYRAFLEMVPALATAFPDRTFVVRPHPSENHEPWRKATVDCPNVHVIHQGNVVSWLIAADALIHNSCTTAIEAYCLGTPPITYRPAISGPFDLDLPNDLSYCAVDLSALWKLLDAACDGTIAGDLDHEGRRRALMDHHVTGLSGPLVSDRIVDALEDFHSEWRNEPPRNQWSRFTGKLHGKVRSLEKSVNWIRPGHNNHQSYVEHMFEELSSEDISQRLERFQRVLGRFNDVRVEKISRNVFKLSA